MYKAHDREIKMEPIRVLNLFTIMNRGGAETMVMNYYRNIDRTKVQFDFLVHRQERGAYEDEIESLGGKIYRMIPIYPQNFSKYKKMLHQFFSEHKEYKIIHSHMSELGYFAFKEAKEQGIPVRICHAHNAPQGWDMKMVMRTYFKKKMIPYLTHMFTCGTESARWLYGPQYEDQFIQLNNAIDAEKFRYNIEKEKQVRKELELDDRLVIGHVGRFHKQKNHEFLIDIFYEIQKIRPDAVLLLIGNGDLEDKIKEKIRKKHLESCVKFLGLRSDVNKLMQCFDVFLFPSLFEGLGIVLIEAQAAGAPCITSEKVVPKEAKVSSLLHYFSLKKTEREWAMEVFNILNHENSKKDMCQVIRTAHYDINDNASWLERFYINVCQK